jgi:hypothetical protein
MALSVPEPSICQPGGHAQLASAEYDGALSGIVRIATDCAKSVWHATEEEGEAVLLILRIWEATAHAIIKDLEAGRTVLLPPLGIFKSNVSLGALGTVAEGDQRAEEYPLPLFILADEFSDRYGLENDPQALEELQTGPRVKFSSVGVARTAEVSKDVAQNALTAVIHRIGEAMAMNPQVTISFAPLCNLVSKDRIVSLEAIHRDFGAYSARSGPTVRGFLAPKQIRENRLVAKELTMLMRNTGRSTSSAFGLSGKAGSALSRPLSPRSLQTSSRHGKDGQDTTTDAKSIIEGNFHRNLPENSVQYPPLLNEYSRTLAVPYTGAQEPGFPSGRIAASITGAASWLTSRLPGLTTRSLQWYPNLEDVSGPTLPKKDH